MVDADLHLHSRHSDGEWAVAKIVGEARAAGLSAIALTDHDTLTGVAEAVALGRVAGLEVLTGVEISTWNGGDLHLLGYGFDEEDSDLLDLFERARSARRDRAAVMVEKLAELGKAIPLESVLREAAGGAVGRPHVARALLRAGQVGSIREAFERYIGDGKPACAEKLRVTPEAAIERIHRAGGVVVAAHPGAHGGMAALDALVEAGIDGVEADHPLHDPATVRRLTEFAGAHGLLRTGGSDFHGPGVNGSGPGSVRIPRERVEELLGRVAVLRAAARDSA
ncbi:MAG: PHP domain-containing protein [Candidatus Eiseniibacteriota bacterium]